jgi:peptidoglycan/xylan/chitin deacetylase (PgdA/CDA1 family)
VLEYHDAEYKAGKTVQMKTGWFLDQMQWLDDNGFKTLTGGQLTGFVLGESRPARESCVLRFDLGLPAYRSFHGVIIQALEKHSFHAIFFVLTSMIRETCEGNYHCWDQLREWEQAGLIEIGSHGANHPDYRKMSPANCRQDAQVSKHLIESKIGHPISFLAFPYDSVPDRADELLKPLGYSLALAGYRQERSVLFKDPDPYGLPCYYPYSSDQAYPVIAGTRGLTFGQMIQGAVAISKE